MILLRATGLLRAYDETTRTGGGFLFGFLFQGQVSSPKRLEQIPRVIFFASAAFSDFGTAKRPYMATVRKPIRLREPPRILRLRPRWTTGKQKRRRPITGLQGPDAYGDAVLLFVGLVMNPATARIPVLGPMRSNDITYLTSSPVILMQMFRTMTSCLCAFLGSYCGSTKSCTT